MFMFAAIAFGFSGGYSTGLAQDATPVASDAFEAPFSAGGESDAWTPVLVSVVDSQTAPVRGTDGQFHVVYDLMLTNTGSEPATIDAITVIDAVDGTEVQTFTGYDLVADEIIRHLNRAPAEDAVLPADSSRLLLVTIAFAEESDVPAAISHQLDIQAMGSFSIAPEPFSYRAGVIDLSSMTAPVVSPPLQGDGWIAAEGCCDPASHHVNGIFPINGTFYAGQRFAIDFIQINDEGMLVEGDLADVNNWEGYGKPVVAVADGIVLDAYDQFEDGTPPIFPDMSTLSPNKNTGNFVLIQHDDGLISAYFHLKPGSVVVNVGDRVTAGDQLASVGNSGGSQVPHLHFEIIDQLPPASANGLPYTFDSFEVSGQADSAQLLDAIEGRTGYPIDPAGPVAHENELPLSYTILNFPGE
jgi:hypothetical protein